MYKFLIALLLFTACFIEGQTDSVISTVRLVNVNNDSTDIPFLGKKVVIIFYVDPDVQGLTRPVSAALEEEKFSLERNEFIGVVNCKETWLPNALIRMRARKEQELHPQSLILLDYDRLLARAWNLGDCNNKVLLRIIGRNFRVVYNKAISSEDESKAVVPGFMNALRHAQK